MFSPISMKSGLGKGGELIVGELLLEHVSAVRSISNLPECLPVEE